MFLVVLTLVYAVWKFLVYSYARFLIDATKRTTQIGEIELNAKRPTNYPPI